MEPARFGTLVVVVDKARNLPNRKRIGKQDAYAIVRLGHEVQRTPTDKRAGQVPSWNHEIRFKVPHENENILKISVFNEDSKTPDLIGDCSIDLTDLYRKHEFDSWFDLKYKEKPAGELYAELTFYYEGPPKPKPKVQLPDQGTYHARSGTPSNASFSRHLPIIPGEPKTHSLSYQRPLSPERPNSAVPEMIYAGNDTTRAFADHNYELPCAVPIDGPSYLPAHVDVAYAETWDGTRDNRVHHLAPGDMRRKSTSNEQYNPAAIGRDLANVYSDLRIDEQQPRRRVMGPRQNIIGSRPMPVSQSQLYHAQVEHFHQGAPGSVTTGLELSSTGQIQASPTQVLVPSPSLERIMADTQYVEPLLDPRHGSVHELRDSPRIADLVSAATYESEHTPRQQSATSLRSSHDELGSLERHCAQLDYHNGHHIVPNHHSREPQREALYRHGQAQSVSYVSKPYEDKSRGQPNYHSKAASTSIIPADMRSRMNQQYSGQGRPHVNAPDYVQAINYQHPATYAVTPAEYRSRERALPLAPHAPPSLPAKIPLGLTQAEYDILYER